jgi:hypothetical protein
MVEAHVQEVPADIKRVEQPVATRQASRS